MKSTELKYFKVKALRSELQLEFTTLNDFKQFVDEQHLKTVFLLVNDKEEPTHFAVMHKGGLMQQLTQGFKSLEDYVLSLQNRFPDSVSFYEAQNQGYKTFEDYKLVTEAGIADKMVFDKMKQAGFIDGYKNFKPLICQNKALPAADSFANPYDLYQYAIKQGFEGYEIFKKAYQNGFADAATFNVATEKGFELASDYEDALNREVNSMQDLLVMREHKVRDKRDFDKYIDLTYLHKTGCLHDQCVLLVLLSKLEVGKKISINKLNDLYKKALEEYRYTDNQQMPPWFTTAFAENETLIEFLKKHDAVKKYGHYDSDGEFFETNRLQERKVVIDGSNVAHNSHGNGKTQPRIANLITMVTFLKQKGFAEITVINDAALRHRLSDQDQLPQLKKMVEYIESPAETPADVFIIRYVKRNHCLLVSNDTYREWKINDPWVAENIDFYRLSFLINDDKVLMPDLDKQ